MKNKQKRCECEMKTKGNLEEMILKSKSLKVSDVAYAVGFNDAHYFTICFKNIIGVTPSEYKIFNKD